MMNSMRMVGDPCTSNGHSDNIWIQLPQEEENDDAAEVTWGRLKTLIL